MGNIIFVQVFYVCMNHSPVCLNEISFRNDINNLFDDRQV